MNNKNNENINISKILAFSFVFIFLILPIKFSFAFSLPSSEANSIFVKLREEIATIHRGMLNESIPSPPEEAVVVIIKSLINKELGVLKFKKLPKEFLIKTLTEGGKMAFSMATSDPFELITSEVVNKSVDEIIDILKEERVYVNGGEVNLSYTDLNQNKRKEVIYYSIIMNKKTGETSASFYSNKEIFAPRSNPGLEPANYKWSINKFKGEKLKPFSINFSGKAKEGKRTMGFVGKPTINITFYTPGV
jgi:hypothetical protein